MDTPQTNPSNPSGPNGNKLSRGPTLPKITTITCITLVSGPAAAALEAQKNKRPLNGTSPTHNQDPTPLTRPCHNRRITGCLPHASGGSPATYPRDNAYLCPHGGCPAGPPGLPCLTHCNLSVLRPRWPPSPLPYPRLFQRKLQELTNNPHLSTWAPALGPQTCNGWTHAHGPHLAIANIRTGNCTIPRNETIVDTSTTSLPPILIPSSTKNHLEAATRRVNVLAGRFTTHNTLNKYMAGLLPPVHDAYPTAIFKHI